MKGTGSKTRLCYVPKYCTESYNGEEYIQTAHVRLMVLFQVLKHCPPLADTTLPVIQPDSGLHTMATTPAISSTYAGRPPHLFAMALTSSVSHSRAPESGMTGLQRAWAASTSSLQLRNMSVRTEPGLMVLTVHCSASSRAQVRVMASRAPLVPLYRVR